MAEASQSADRELLGLITAVLAYRPESGWGAVAVRDDNQGRTVTLIGKMKQPCVGNRIRYEGLRYERDPGTNRFAFRIVESSKELPPVSKAFDGVSAPQHPKKVEAPAAPLKIEIAHDAVVKVLREFDGVGPAMAERLASAFGAGGELELLNALDQSNGRLLSSRSNVSAGLCAGLCDQWRAEARKHRGRILVMSLGLNRRQAESALGRALNALTRAGQPGDAVRAAHRIAMHPYRLTLIDGIGFATADSAARRLGLPSDHPQRIAAAARQALEDAAKSGDTVMPMYELAEKTSQLLNGSVPGRGRRAKPVEPAPGLDPLSIAHVIWTLDESDGVLFPKGRKDALDVVALLRIAKAEAAIAKGVVRLLAGPLRTTIETPDEAALVEMVGRELHPAQLAALTANLNSGVGLITGGPGSGKTTILQALLGSLERSGLSVALAAPTGAAARRMREATGRRAVTVHRLLGSQGFGRGFKHDERNPIPADVIVVDEATMNDVGIAAALVGAVAPGCRLIKVGDQDQLPSVGPGAVFADLIASGVPPVGRLTKIYRIAEASDPGDENPTSILMANVRDGVPEIPEPDGRRFRFNKLRDRSAIGKATIDAFMELRELGVSPEEMIILTPVNRGPDGVTSINQRLQAILTPGAADRGLAIGGDDGSSRIYAAPGDRVMHRTNDDALDLANGDVGTVKEIGRSRRSLIVRFGERDVEIFGARLFNLHLAYACTIHKSQGSQYEHVIMAVSPSHKEMLRRNLIYTGVTRHRHCLHLIGDPDTLIYGIHQVQDTQRRTLLQELLREEAATLGPNILTFDDQTAAEERPAFNKQALLSMMPAA